MHRDLGIWFIFNSYFINAKNKQLCNGIAYDKLNHLLEKVMMNKAILAEIELFDNPEYYNRFQNTKKDIYTIGDAIWNIINCLV